MKEGTSIARSPGSEDARSLRPPGTWLTEVPVLRDLRIPSRFMVLGAFATALLAGLGARAAAADRRRLGAVAVVGVCLLPSSREWSRCAATQTPKGSASRT